MWSELAGKWAYITGTNNSASPETIPHGAVILSILAQSDGSTPATVSIFGGAAIPVSVKVPGIGLQFSHMLCVSKTGADTIVFTGTASYWVEYVTPGQL